MLRKVIESYLHACGLFLVDYTVVETEGHSHIRCLLTKYFKHKLKLGERRKCEGKVSTSNWYNYSVYRNVNQGPFKSLGED